MQRIQTTSDLKENHCLLFCHVGTEEGAAKTGVGGNSVYDCERKQAFTRTTLMFSKRSFPEVKSEKFTT